MSTINKDKSDIKICKGSKDDMYSPSFIPIQCPICFDCIWSSDERITCNKCHKTICAVCCHKMKQSRSLIIQSHRKKEKFIACPFCRTKKFSIVSDIENATILEGIEIENDRESLITSQRRHEPRTNNHNYDCYCHTNNYTRLFMIIMILFILYIIIIMN